MRTKEVLLKENMCLIHEHLKEPVWVHLKLIIPTQDYFLSITFTYLLWVLIGSMQRMCHSVHIEAGLCLSRVGSLLLCGSQELNSDHETLWQVWRPLRHLAGSGLVTITKPTKDKYCENYVTTKLLSFHPDSCVIFFLYWNQQGFLSRV